MIAHRIGFAAWLFVSSFCPALNASAHLSCENVEAPLIGDDVPGNGNRCAEIISPQGTRKPRPPPPQVPPRTMRAPIGNKIGSSRQPESRPPHWPDPTPHR